MKTDLTTQIIETTEVRRHNGQCEYGDWEPLADQPPHVIEAVADEIAEAMFRDIRHEPAADENTDDGGTVQVGGMRWVYRR